MFAALIFLSFLGPFIVDVLYDARYSMAGMILVLVACAQLPLAVGLTYDHNALASGNSRQFFVVVSIKATMMISLSLIGVYYFDVAGAVAGQGAAHLITLPVIIWLARYHRAWDALHDTVFCLAMFVIGGAALWLHRDGISDLIHNGATG